MVLASLSVTDDIFVFTRATKRHSNGKAEMPRVTPKGRHTTLSKSTKTTKRHEASEKKQNCCNIRGT